MSMVAKSTSRCFIILFLTLFGCNQQSKALKQAVAVKKLNALLYQKEYFRLEKELKLCSENLDDKNKLYYKCFIDNSFNRNEECIRDVNSLLTNSSFKFPDSVSARLIRLKADSYFKTFRYAKAAQSDSDLIKHYRYAIHEDAVDDIKNDLLLRTALKNIPPQQTIIRNTVLIPWTRDKIGLIEIPVRRHGQNYNGIFDTRANISSITQSYAGKLGLHILNAVYNEGSGSTGINFKTGIGIADSLQIGNITVKNVLFQVMPDTILYLAPIKYQLNMIIGFPVIEQLREVDLFKDGRMVIPVTPAKSSLHNFALDHFDPVIALKSGKDTLLFDFDSGAITSELYAAYFARYKNVVLKNGIKRIAEFGGAGGTQKKAIFILPAFHLSLADKPVTIDSMTVLTKKIYANERFYGNIGQDFIANFSEVVFNFKYMYVRGVK